MAFEPKEDHDAHEATYTRGDRSKLRQVDVLVSQGQTVADAIRSIGVTEVTYYRWRQEYGGLKADQVRRLKGHRQLVEGRSRWVGCCWPYAAATTPLTSAHSSKALVRAARYSVAVTCSRQRGKRLLIWSWVARKRCAWPADLNRFIWRSRRRVG